MYPSAGSFAVSIMSSESCGMNGPAASCGVMRYVVSGDRDGGWLRMPLCVNRLEGLRVFDAHSPVDRTGGKPGAIEHDLERSASLRGWHLRRCRLRCFRACGGLLSCDGIAGGLRDDRQER